MFIKLRKFSESPLAKILLLILALSLIIWGIKIGSNNQNYVATIGDKNFVSVIDFKRVKTNFLRNTNKYKQSIDDSNINQEILKILIQNELLKAEANSLGLIIGENVALKTIRKMSVFKDKDGKFDKNVFKNALAMNGIHASKFLANIKDELAINILSSIFTTYSPSKKLIREFYNYEEQKRVVDLITIKLSESSTNTPITDKDIKSYYSTHKNKFAIPESRDVEYVTITPDEYKNKINQLKEEIKNDLIKNNKPNNIEIINNLVNNKINKLIYDKVKKIEEEISAGNTLKEIATKHKLPYKFVEKISRSNSQNIPQFNQFLTQVFSTSENEPSDTILIDGNKIASGYYILNVSKIYDTHHKPLDEETKKEIIKLIQLEQKEKISQEKAVKFYNLITSEKKSLKDIIKDNPNISVQEITISKTSPNIDANLLMSIFSLKNKNSYTNIFRSKKTNIFQLALVKKIQLPSEEPSSEQAKIIEAKLANFITDGINQEFLNYLYKKHKVTVFPKTLEKL
ncbi:MAG: SurA N-terminal domain-containing protein [Rickettsiales bacterium]|nr:SurA N-terminal domain-containing protein [Rickettsiales bacterium]